MTLKAFAEELVAFSTSANDIHEEMLILSNSRDPDLQFPYHRFNVHGGMNKIGLEEYEKILEIGALTRGYLEEKETQMALERCVGDLVKPARVERMY